jgi:cobalt/nickel transport system permease protein
VKTSFIERSIASLLSTSEYAIAAEDLAGSIGALQGVDPRVKVAGLFMLILVVAASRRIEAIAAVFVCALPLALASHIRLRRLAEWVWLPVLFFTGTIAAPALFLTPGVPVLSAGILTITQQGLRGAAFLVSRAETAATLSALLVLTTPWPWVLKALRTFRCPAVFAVILGMTYRYVFVILGTALDMFESRKSRTVGVLEPADRRRISAAIAGVLLSKSVQLSGEVHLAMQSRGFRGEVYIMQDFRTKAADWCWLGGFVSIAGGAAWFAIA